MRKPATFKEAGITEQRERDELLMMIRIVTVFNPETGYQRKVGVMIDGGSTETYFTRELSEELGLIDGPEKRINVIRFGSTSGETDVRGPMNRLGVKKMDGSHFIIDGLVVEDFFPSLLPFAVKTIHTWNPRKTELPRSTFIKPDILLGMQHIGLLGLLQQEVTKQGYVIYDSSIGPIVCGGPRRSHNDAMAFTGLCDQLFPIEMERERETAHALSTITNTSFKREERESTSEPY
jgi:hypothetical protein